MCCLLNLSKLKQQQQQQLQKQQQICQSYNQAQNLLLNKGKTAPWQSEDARVKATSSLLATDVATKLAINGNQAKVSTIQQSLIMLQEAVAAELVAAATTVLWQQQQQSIKIVWEKAVALLIAAMAVEHSDKKQQQLDCLRNQQQRLHQPRPYHRQRYYLQNTWCGR